eukprot:Gb_23360 [translate_table: standard]
MGRDIRLLRLIRYQKHKQGTSFYTLRNFCHLSAFWFLENLPVGGRYRPSLWPTTSVSQPPLTKAPRRRLGFNSSPTKLFIHSSWSVGAISLTDGCRFLASPTVTVLPPAFQDLVETKARADDFGEHCSDAGRINHRQAIIRLPTSAVCRESSHTRIYKAESTIATPHITSSLAQGLTCLGMQIHIHKNMSIAQGGAQPLSRSSQAASVDESAIFYPGMPRTRPGLPWYANKVIILLAHTVQSSDCLTRWSVARRCCLLQCPFTNNTSNIRTLANTHSFHFSSVWQPNGAFSSPPPQTGSITMPTSSPPPKHI